MFEVDKNRTHWWAKMWVNNLKNIFLEKDYKEIEALAPKLKKEVYSGKCSLVEGIYARFDKELTRKLTNINKLIIEILEQKLDQKIIELWLTLSEFSKK